MFLDLPTHGHAIIPRGQTVTLCLLFALNIVFQGMLTIVFLLMKTGDTNLPYKEQDLYATPAPATQRCLTPFEKEVTFCDHNIGHVVVP